MNKIRLFLLSGVVLAFSAQAAQNAKINFPFRTPAGEMPAGNYRVDVLDGTGSKFVQLRNMETNRAVVFNTQWALNKVRPTSNGELVFSCRKDGCNLAQVWSTGMVGYAVKQKKAAPAEPQLHTVVSLKSDSASE